MSSKEAITTSTDHGTTVQSDPKMGIKVWLVLLSVNMIYFTQTVNVVGSGTLTTHITTVLGSPTDRVWFTQVLAILTAILSIPVTQAAGFWGRKIFLVILTTCGCIGSTVVARANGIGAAIAGFAITGLSFGAQPLLHAVSSEILARKHRSFAQASVNVASVLGAILGLVVGGALTRTSDAGFRVYWGIVAAPALVLFCMALSWSQNPYQWTNTHMLVPFIVGVVLVIVLVIYETIVRKDAMFLHDLFRHRNFPIALGCVFAEGIVFFCGNNYFAYEVSVLFFTDSLITGVHYAVAFIAFAISSKSKRSASLDLPRDVADAVLPLNFPESRLPQLIQALIAGDNVALSNIIGANSNIISAVGEGLHQAKVLSFCYVWVSQVSSHLLPRLVSPLLSDTSSFTYMPEMVYLSYFLDFARSD
ncbi:Major facilitator superfamily domain, general substrate transporter [Penicillium occitanis (nom. inval.)]|nr:Major facilitator superfamily domain, general substrate transporter [Penicillium occitanis (nom. inval.)]PCH10407.1 hypothetical protein PENOC_000750 [Penicillium occitanis (nom. inval.)]